MTVLTAVSCGSSTDSSSSAATEPVSATSITSSPATTTTTPPADGDECNQSPPAAEPGDFDFTALEESLRDTPAEVRLPADPGFPTEVVAVGEDVVVLEEVTDIDHSSGSGESLYSRSDLVLRRVATDGSTTWTVRLGTFVDWYRSYQQSSLAFDGETVRVSWPRYDGDLPAPLYTAVPATLVMSAVSIDGQLESEVDLQPIPALDPAETGVSFTAAMGASGTVASGRAEGGTLVVDTFDPSGLALWRDEIEASPSPIPLVAVLADDEVAAAWGGHLIRWTADGDRKWDLPVEPSSLAPITAESGSSDADLVVGITGDGSWYCAIDPEGRLLLRTAEARGVWGSAERAWWTESGLMLLSSYITLSANDNLIVVGHDGNTLWDVQLSWSGDVVPAPSSAVHDATVTDTGDVVLAAAVTGYPAGAEATYENLESWRALIRLPAPAGSGDLSQLPAAPE